MQERSSSIVHDFRQHLADMHDERDYVMIGTVAFITLFMKRDTDLHHSEGNYFRRYTMLHILYNVLISSSPNPCNISASVLNICFTFAHRPDWLSYLLQQSVRSSSSSISITGTGLLELPSFSYRICKVALSSLSIF